MRALAIDDSSFIRHSLHSLLTSHGVQSVEPAIGVERLNFRLRRNPFALADWNMPGQIGLDVFRKARPGRSKAENNRGDAALRAGADGYIVTPVDEAPLFEKLRFPGVEGL